MRAETFPSGVTAALPQSPAMLFSSTVFLFYFLPIVLGLYVVVRGEARNLVLVVASLFFYAWGEHERVAIMLLSIAGNWALGVLIGDRPRTRRARIGLLLGIVFNVGILVSFKYLNFAVDNVNALRSTFGAAPLAISRVVLPIGVSFFTFQALSYLIDLYRGDTKVQRSLLRFALYKSLFPQLIAGPIVRYRDVAPEIARRTLTRAGFAYGIRRFTIGLGKKMLIANSAAAGADAIFALPSQHLTTATAWLGVACYTIQIYFDFSGYSDMAIGLGRMFGFTFLENFRWPYVAQSITEFWRRWHISLSSWFRDYVYIPLGGNRGGRGRTWFNLVFVFFLCGLWHGASWTFVIWGLYHGAFLVLERAGVGGVLERAPRVLRHGYTMLVVMVGWVCFRADSAAAAMRYLATMAGFSRSSGLEHPFALYFNGERALVLALGCIGSTPWLVWAGRRIGEILARSPARARPGIALGREVLALGSLGLVFFLSACWLASGTHNPFIYFRF